MELMELLQVSKAQTGLALLLRSVVTLLVLWLTYALAHQYSYTTASRVLIARDYYLDRRLFRMSTKIVSGMFSALFLWLVLMSFMSVVALALGAASVDRFFADTVNGTMVSLITVVTAALVAWQVDRLVHRKGYGRDGDVF